MWLDWLFIRPCDNWDMNYPNCNYPNVRRLKCWRCGFRSSISSLNDDGLVRALTAKVWMGLVIQRDTEPDPWEIRGLLEWLLMPWADRERSISMVRIHRKVKILEPGPGSRQHAEVCAKVSEENQSPHAGRGSLSYFLRMQEFQSRSPQPGSLIPRQEARKG